MKSIKSLILVFLLTSGIIASAQDIQIYTADNSNGKITGASIEKVFADAGFKISGHNDMNVAFQGKFQKTNHKMYHLFTLYKKDLVLELIKLSPKAALFTPLSMSLYMDKGSNDISISSISFFVEFVRFEEVLQNLRRFSLELLVGRLRLLFYKKQLRQLLHLYEYR